MPNYINDFTEYPDVYVESVFGFWYRAGRPKLYKLDSIEGFPEHEGKRPSRGTIKKWIDKFGWEERADALDAQAAVTFEKGLVKERVRLLRELALSGKILKDKGLDFIQNSENPFQDNVPAAVRAVISGAEMEFKYAGAADILANVSGMSDKQIQSKIAELLSRQENEVIDADLSEEDDEGNDS